MLSIVHAELPITMALILKTNNPFATPHGRRQLLWIFTALVMMSSWANAEPQASQAGILQPQQLNALSQQLINKVKTGTAEATKFRITVVYYRESLRGLMLANEKATSHKITSELLMKMVRMSALLQSAAECQTGRYISCPVNLLHELDQQQQQLTLPRPGAKSSP